MMRRVFLLCLTYYGYKFILFACDFVVSLSDNRIKIIDIRNGFISFTPN